MASPRAKDVAHDMVNSFEQVIMRFEQVFINIKSSRSA